MKIPDALFHTHGYSVLWQGSLSLSDILWRYDQNARLFLTNGEELDVNNKWSSLAQQGKELHDGPLYRVLSVSEDDGLLEFKLGATGYKEYLGTNVDRPDWAVADPDQKMSNPLGLSAVAITKDGMVLMQLRSKMVGTYPGLWQITPSGHVGPPNSLLEAMEEELWEELDVSPDEIDGQVTLTGLMLHKERGKLDATLLLDLKITSDQILSRTAQDSWEYDFLKALKWDCDSIATFLFDHAENIVPSGHAALLLAGRLAFGDQWFNEVAPFSL